MVIRSWFTSLYKLIAQFIGKFGAKYRFLVIDKKTRQFVEHNKLVWSNYKKNEYEAEVLFELTGMQTSIIAFSYLSNVLAKKHNARIRGYCFGENIKISPAHRKIYESFNAEAFSYDLNQTQLVELEKMFKEVSQNIRTKEDVFNLKIFDIWIGDLLYDYHLREYSVPTVEIDEDSFRKSLRCALYQFIYWWDYFDSHNVKAINVTHPCYLVAIPLRLAVHKDIAAYQFNIYDGYCFSKAKPVLSSGFADYHRQFLELSEAEQNDGLKIAEERINKRLSGEVGVDMFYSTKSAYTNDRIDRVLSNSDRIKVLIPAHCFFDAPNGYGKNLFVDFYEWLVFLGDISEKTDYEWYLKTHPDFLPGNIQILEMLVQRYPKFTIIPSETSHHQIIEEGINFALTVYGTIGFEYAALGVTVINASMTNPHISYNFNIHPKSIEEYEKILMNLKDQKLKIDINEVYEYYCMKLKNNVQNWLFDDYEAFMDEIGGHMNQFSSVSYQKFLEELSDEKHERLLYSLNNFIESNDYAFHKKHMELAR